MKSVVNLKSDVYYHGVYWNNYSPVVEYMCKNFTGNPKKWWVEDFKERYAQKPFEKALFLNCGDGRWERDFIDKKIVKKVTAFDVSPDLIQKAKTLKGKRPIKYFVADANKVDFPRDKFDLVVNYAALHHTQYINRMCRILAGTIKPDGIFVNFEYIGPHRNQYPLGEWILANLVNRNLPEFVRQDLRYPSLPTMLYMDPSEAIHSELIMKSIKRYFRIIEKYDTGGGVAYLLLTHNSRTAKLPVKKIRSSIDRILYYDNLFSRLHLVPQLFTYFVARSNKEALKNRSLNLRYQNEEKSRERFADKRRGVYSFIDYLKLIYNCKTLRGRLSLLFRYPYLENTAFLIKKISSTF